MSRSATIGVLLDYAQDKVVLVDESEEFTYVNAAAERILGFSPDNSVGTNAFDHVHPEDGPVVRAAMGCLAAGNPLDMEYRVDPENRYNVRVKVQARASVKDGEVVRIAGFSRECSLARERRL